MTTFVTPLAGAVRLRGAACLQSSSNSPPANAEPAARIIAVAIAALFMRALLPQPIRRAPRKVSLFPGRTRCDHLHGAPEPARARLRLLRALDRFNVLALMRERQLLPSLPRRRRRLQRFHEVRRRLYFALIRVEIEPHFDALVSLEPGRLAIALPQRNAYRAAHRRDRAAVRVAVHRHLHRRAHLSEDRLRIERHRDVAHRLVAMDFRFIRLARHQSDHTARPWISRRFSSRCTRTSTESRDSTKSSASRRSRAGSTLPPRPKRRARSICCCAFIGSASGSTKSATFHARYSR